MKRGLLALAAVLVVAAIVAGAWRSLAPVHRAAAQGRALRDDLAARAARVSPQWRADVEEVKRDEALWSVLAPPRARDAAPYLSARVAWDGAAPPAQAIGVVPHELEALLLGDDFLARVDELDLDALDTGWMAALPGFTHWDLEADPRASPPDVPALAASRPQTMPLLAWGRARLAQGLLDGDLDAASQEARALARLLWSTDGLIEAMIATQLLVADAAARELGRAVDAPTDVAQDIRSVAKLEKVLRSSPVLYQLATPDVVAGYEEGDVMFCAALREGASTFLVARSLFAPAYSQRERAIARAIEASPCQLGRVRRQWRDGTGELPLDGLVRDGGTLKNLVLGSVLRAWLRDMVLAATSMSVAGYFADDP